MVKLVLVGVWACLITLASSHAATYWKASQQKAASAEAPVQNLEYRKSRELTIPKIVDGAVAGYIVVQFSYSVDPALEKTGAPPEPFLLDEAFRYIYADDTIDFSDLKKYDIQKMTKSLVQNVNARLTGNLLKDVLIQEFNYVSRADIKRQM